MSLERVLTTPGHGRRGCGWAGLPVSAESRIRLQKHRLEGNHRRGRPSPTRMTERAGASWSTLGGGTTPHLRDASDPSPTTLADDGGCDNRVRTCGSTSTGSRLARAGHSVQLERARLRGGGGAARTAVTLRPLPLCACGARAGGPLRTACQADVRSWRKLSRPVPVPEQRSGAYPVPTARAPSGARPLPGGGPERPLDFFPRARARTRGPVPTPLDEAITLGPGRGRDLVGASINARRRARAHTGPDVPPPLDALIRSGSAAGPRRGPARVDGVRFGESFP